MAAIDADQAKAIADLGVVLYVQKDGSYIARASKEENTTIGTIEKITSRRWRGISTFRANPEDFKTMHAAAGWLAEEAKNTFAFENPDFDPDADWSEFIDDEVDTREIPATGTVRQIMDFMDCTEHGYLGTVEKWDDCGCPEEKPR